MLEVAPTDAGLSLHLDAVLLQGHPLHLIPETGDQHCYRDAWLTIAGIDEVRLSGAPPATDATGTPDLRHVDLFQFDAERATWVLSGDWGTAEATEPSVTIDFA